MICQSLSSYYYDDDTGLYYLQSRYYDPQIGRFINADALVSTGQGVLGNNIFAYCRNNPVKRADTLGTDDICVTDDNDGNPLDDLMYSAGGGGSSMGSGYSGYAYAYNPVDAGYSYHISFDVAMYSSLYTGGIYQVGYDAFEVYSNPTSTSSTSTSAIKPSACFIAGTLVQGEDGAVAIEDIAVGDMVWAWNETTGDIALKEVVETYINQSDELIHVFVNGEEIITTPTHPFYSPLKGWTAAAKLRAGDILVLVNSEYVVVEKVQHEILEAPITVYNFQVEGYHTYYVANAGVLVHNMCPVKPTNSEATEVAKKLGYTKVRGKLSHGQAVFFNHKASSILRYISIDTESHIGGFWKAASSIERLARKETRSGTYNWNLTERLGD